MQMDHAPASIFQGRVNPGLPEAELKAALEAVRDAFGEDWLTGNQSHPVRDLWSRNDFLATSELFWLGDSILRITPTAQRWVDDVVSDIESPNRNVRVGALFELFAMAMFASDGQRVEPTRRGNPHFDGDVILKNLRLRMSLKNFGAPSRELEFEKRSEEVRQEMLKTGRARGTHWVGMLVQAAKYPDSTDWETLRAEIPTLTQNPNGTYAIGDMWTITVHDAAVQDLESSQLSSSLLVIAPHHKNEQKNFMDKIEEQCRDLNEAAAGYDSEISSVAMLRLSENAPFEDYVAWAQDYVNQPKTRLTGIILYQTAVAINMEKDATQIHHHINVVWKDGIEAPNLRCTVPVGVPSATPARMELQGGSKTIQLGSGHFYQRRDLYRSLPVGDSAERSGSIRQISGSTEHLVLGVPGGESVVLSPKHKTLGYLTLFS